MRSILPLFASALAASAPVLATELVPVAQFNSVELRGGGAVTVVPGPEQKVTILEGSREVTRMRVERDGKLRIDTCEERCPPVYRQYLLRNRQTVRFPAQQNLSGNGFGQ